MLKQLDVSAVTSREELHSLIAQAFGFPDYYGDNWDAFDECIRDYLPSAEIHVSGMAQLATVLPREATLLKSCLQGYAEEAPNQRKVVCP